MAIVVRGFEHASRAFSFAHSAFNRAMPMIPSKVKQLYKTGAPLMRMKLYLFFNDFL